MILRQLTTGQVYVVVLSMKDWEGYPLPQETVARWTILSVFRSENTSPYALAFFNFSRNLEMVKLSDIHIFDRMARTNGESGLTLAYA